MLVYKIVLPKCLQQASLPIPANANKLSNPNAAGRWDSKLTISSEIRQNTRKLAIRTIHYVTSSKKKLGCFSKPAMH